MRKNLHSLWLCTGGIVAVSGMASGAITIDGRYDSDYGAAKATQVNPTGFGNNSLGNVNTANGSELDAAYAVIPTGSQNVYIFIAGNLETNSNNINLFIADGRTSGGQSTLKFPAGQQNGVSNLNDSTFASGFKATYSLDINGDGTKWNVNKYDLSSPTAPTAAFLGSYNTTSGLPAASATVGNSTAGFVTMSLDNSSTAGLSNTTSGLELAIPLSSFNTHAGTLEIMADINGGGNNYLSNQFLPSLAAGSGNIGNTPPHFNQAANQWFTVTIPVNLQNKNGNWTAVGNGSWGDITKWDIGQVPTNAGDSASFASATGPSAVALDGSRTVGQVIFDSANSYTVSVGTGGTLTIDDTGDGGGVSPYIQVNSGSHTISAPLNVIGSTSSATTLLDVVADTSVLTISGAITGTGGIGKDGPGKVVLSASNSFSGGCNIYAGTLELDNANAVGANTITMGVESSDNQAAELSIGSSGLTISNPIITNHDGAGNALTRIISPTFTGSGTATLTGPMTLNGGLLAAAPSGTTLALNGMITDGVDTYVNAKHEIHINSLGTTGTVALNASNSYSGLTSVASGLLLLGNSNAAGTGNIFVGNGGQALADNSASLLASSDGLTIANPLSTNKSDNGTTTGLGTRTIGGSNTTGSVTYTGGVTLNGGAVLAAAAGGTVAFTGVIADGTDTGNVSRSVTISGPGTVLLTNVNTYSGNTTVTAGALAIASGDALPTTTNLTVTGGSATFAATNGGGTKAATLQGVAVSSGGSIVLQSPAAHGDRTVYSIASLAFAGSAGAWAGSVDIGDNDLSIGSITPADLISQARQGLNIGGAIWAGTNGLVSSKAASDTHLTRAIGIGSGSTSVAVKSTFFGDADLDGVVGPSDYTLIDTGITGNLTGWQNGDFNYDGTIDAADYSLIDNAFAFQGLTGSLAAAPLAVALSATAGGAAVPEPTSIGLITLVGGLLARRRRPQAG